MLDQSRPVFVWLVQPEGYSGIKALAETAKLIEWTFGDLGYDVQFLLQSELPDRDAQVFVIGAHLLTFMGIQGLPNHWIVYNLEQFNPSSEWFKSGYLELLKSCVVLDYSPLNVRLLREQGVRQVSLLPYGFHPNMVQVPDVPDHEKRYDVLFYGTLNAERERKLNILSQGGVNITTMSQAYGEQRDALIAFSRLVVNFHYYDTGVFNIHRAAYLFANKACVVSEYGLDIDLEAPHYEHCIFGHLVQMSDLIHLALEDVSQRESIARRAQEYVIQCPMSRLISQALDVVSQGVVVERLHG